MLSEAVLCQQESAQTMLKTEPFSWHPASGARDRQRVRLLLIRHALSCANMVQQYVSGGRVTKNLLKDPVLTACGAFRSKQAGKLLAAEGSKQESVLFSPLAAAEGFKPDLVLSSSMMRAMETAAYMFPMNMIIPVPYISEKSTGTGADQDNTPDDYRAQMRRLQNKTGSYPKFFNGTWALHKDFAGEDRKKADWDRFLKFMANTFLPNIPKELQEKDSLSIAVVSHSHFIAHVPEVEKLCAKFYDKKPENNQVLILPYELQGHISLADNTDLWQIATIPVDPYIGDDEAIVVAKESGINYTHMEVSRTLKLAAKATCVNLEDVYVKGKPEYLCQKDIGAACEQSISDSIPMIHLPTTQGMLTAAEAKLQKLRDQGDGIDKQGPVMEKIAQLQSFRCCTPI